MSPTILPASSFGLTGAAPAAGTAGVAAGGGVLAALNPIGLAVSALLTIGSLYEGRRQRKKANMAAEQAATENLRQRLLAARNARVQAVKEVRATQAAVRAASAAQGVSGSSGEFGVASSVASQFGARTGLVTASNQFAAAEAAAATRQQKNLETANRADQVFSLSTLGLQMFK